MWCKILSRTSVRVILGASMMTALALPVRAQTSEQVPLADLLAFAETHAPLVRLAEARLGYGEAARADAGLAARHNPSLEMGIGPRFNGGSDRDFDFVVSLGQPVSLGTRRPRREAAARTSERLEAELEAARVRTRADIVAAYGEAVFAKEMLALGARLRVFAETLHTVAQRRGASGDGTSIDAHLATVELATVLEMELVARQTLAAARLRLAELSGWPVATPPDVVTARAAVRDVPSLESALRAAEASHPELVARRAAIAETEAAASLAAADGRPVPVVGVQIAREGSVGSPANYIALGTLGLSIPVSQRNQGARARARADHALALEEAAIAGEAVHARIARAHAALMTAEERLAIHTDRTQPAIDAGLALLERGFSAGELSMLNVTVARTRFVEAQRAALTAYAEYFTALAELEAAVGTPIAASSAR